MEQDDDRNRINPAEYLDEDSIFTILDILEVNPEDMITFSLVCRQFYTVQSRHRRKLKFRGPQYIPQSLKRYPRLTHLGLNLCSLITDEHIISIANTYWSTLESIDLRNSRFLTHCGLSYLVRNCSWLKEIDLSGVNWLTDYAAMEIYYAKNLEVLKFCRSLISDFTLWFIAASCKKLRVVSLAECSCITDLGVMNLVVACTDIRILDLTHVGVTNTCIPCIASLERLKELIIVGCSCITDAGIRILRERCKNLEKLDASNNWNVGNVGAFGFPQKYERRWMLQTLKLEGVPITKEGIESIRKLPLPLKKLSFYRCFTVTDRWLFSVVQRHNRLKKLNIGHCLNLTNVAIDLLTRWCPSLTSLYMETCPTVTKEGFRLIGPRCHLLEKFDVGNTAIDDEGLRSMSRCSRLVKLYLGNCQSITDDGFTSVGLNFPNLKVLSLKRCLQLTDAGVENIAEGCSVLGEVDLSFCDEITDNSLISLSRCSGLKVLGFKGCPRLTSMGLSVLANGCRQIHVLSITHCSRITDEGIVTLARYARNLFKISVANCKITDVGLLALANIYRLQVINMAYLPRLTPRGVATALLTCSGLTKVRLDANLKFSLDESLIDNMEARGVVFRWKSFD